MPIQSFGQKIKTDDEIIAEIYELVGDKFPLQITILYGKVLNMSFDTEWKEGTTESVPVGEDENGDLLFEYEEHYTDRELTADQIAKLEKWAAENIATN